MRLMLAFDAVDRWESLDNPFDLLMGQPDMKLRIFAVLFLHTFLNILLFFFNLIPVPPLDGSAIWQLVLKQRHYEVYLSYAHNPSFVILGLIAANGIATQLLPYRWSVMGFLVWGI
jgi:Zn-dependent protease